VNGKAGKSSWAPEWRHPATVKHRRAKSFAKIFPYQGRGSSSNWTTQLKKKGETNLRDLGKGVFTSSVDRRRRGMGSQLRNRSFIKTRQRGKDGRSGGCIVENDAGDSEGGLWIQGWKKINAERWGGGLGERGLNLQQEHAAPAASRRRRSAEIEISALGVILQRNRKRGRPRNADGERRKHFEISPKLPWATGSAEGEEGLTNWQYPSAEKGKEGKGKEVTLHETLRKVSKR